METDLWPNVSEKENILRSQSDQNLRNAEVGLEGPI